MAEPTRTESVAASDGDAFDAQLYLPPSGTGPGVLLLQEIFGVGEYLTVRAADLAALGYVVLCPDVFWRVQRNVALGHDEAAMGQAFGYMEQYSALDPATNSADLLAALAHLRALPEVAGGPVAAMGFCLGGRLAYEIAVAGDPDAIVSYYGSGTASRLDDAGAITCPALFHYGGNDPFIPTEEAEAVGATFADRPDADVHIHDGAGHAFDNFAAPMFFHPEAAEVAWQMTTAFLDRTLRGASA